MKRGKFVAVDPICKSFDGKLVEAVQVNGNLLYGQLDANAPRWVVDAFVRGKSADVGLLLEEPGVLEIYRKSGSATVHLGDWIVFCEGDMTKSSPIVFKETYIPVAKETK